jgi:peroxiredoxin
VLFAFVLVAAGACERQERMVASAPVEPAPPFELALAGGGQVRLEELRGKVVLLDFWATWCTPCELEIPELNAFYRESRGRGVELVAISIDEIDPGEVERWAAERGVRYPVAHGSSELAEAYGAFEFPFHVVISRDGDIAERLEPGLHDRDELLEAVTRQLDRPEPGA